MTARTAPGGTIARAQPQRAKDIPVPHPSHGPAGHPTSHAATPNPPAVSAAFSVPELLEHVAELIDSFLAHRTATGSDVNTVRCERTTVTKFCFWLATGRLPERGYRGRLVFAADAAEPGWQPVAPGDAGAGLVIDYRDTLFEAGASEGTRYREILQLGHFYTWLTGRKDNPVSQSKAQVKYRAVPTDTSDRHDSYYTAEDMVRLLRASAEMRAAAQADREGTGQRRRWLAAEVDHLIAYLLWGTGAPATAICALHVTDIDLAGRTITWRHDASEEDAAVGPALDAVTQPIPAGLVRVLTDYLLDVRPELAIGDDRLLVNPTAQSTARAYLPRVVQRLTKRLAAAAGLDTAAGAHTPSRWTKTYAKAILDAPNASLITLMWLQGRRAWNGLERTYGTTKPHTSGITLDHVHAEPLTPAPCAWPHTAASSAAVPA